MKNKSQLKRILSTTAQLGILLVVFVAGGLLLPTYAAPYVASWLPLTTPYEAARQAMSVQVDNRNVNNGETVRIGVSNPAAAVRMTSFSHSCEYEGITLAYQTADDIKRVPCDTALELPERTQHKFMVLTAVDEITYLPIELTLEHGEQLGRLSTVIAVAASGADEKSQLSDTSMATLQTFPESGQ